MIDYEFLRLLVEKYTAAQGRNAFLLIPFSEFPRIESENSMREYDWWAIAISHAFMPKETVLSVANYTINCICVKRMSRDMNLDLTILIPYGTRSRYRKMLYDICNTISKDGDVTLFVNNNPYALKAYVTISEEDKVCAKKVKDILQQNDVQYDTEKGFRELMKEAGIGRAYIMKQLPSNAEKNIFIAILESVFFFPEIDSLAKKGYNASVSVKRKKVFISYCHKDNAFINDIICMLKESGVSLWVDTESIDFGENFSAAISSGIEECDLAVLFLSKNYSNSKYANFELQNIVCKMIQENMNWFTVKLDDVDVKQILPVLQNYKYYDFDETKDITDLVKEIKKRVDQCEST